MSASETRCVTTEVATVYDPRPPDKATDLIGLATASPQMVRGACPGDPHGAAGSFSDVVADILYDAGGR